MKEHKHDCIVVKVIRKFKDKVWLLSGSRDNYVCLWEINKEDSSLLAKFQIGDLKTQFYVNHIRINDQDPSRVILERDDTVYTLFCESESFKDW